MKKIHWLIPFRDNAQDFLYFTDIASIRLRAGVVESNIKKTSWQFSANDLIIENPSIIVVGKITSSQIDIRSKNWLGQLDFYKNTFSCSLKLYIGISILFRDLQIGHANSPSLNPEI